ncbi:MAG TPA: hypothetical protein VEQ37_17065 [Actinomycetota bacterium]|nr:hypothetical protein [Actinomycetota bacterium]
MAGQKDFSHRSLLDKLGVKQGDRVSLLGVNEEGFLSELRAAGAELSVGRRQRQSDHVILAVESMGDLSKIGGLEPFMARNGAMWMVFPKGRKDLREADVIREGVAAGLIDNKVVGFSNTHTALRFVIPLARR